jgi:N-methylhydantoinase B
MAAIDWGDLSTVQPTEVLEARYPLFIEWSRLGTNSGGDGRRRGGLGMRRAMRLEAEGASYSLLSDGAVVPPFGIEGGAAASPVDSFIMREGKKLAFASPGKVGGFLMQKGDVLVIQSAGGGGHGDPLLRDAAEVEEDVREGYITAERAAERYGVVLGDAAATRALRARLDADRLRLAPIPASGPLFESGRVSRRRICPLNPADAGRLGAAEGDLVELVGAHGPALRGWVRLDASVAAGRVPLDERGRGILGASTEPILVRRLGDAGVI